jgi:predicted CoA-substrate-specific enzyme activase
MYSIGIDIGYSSLKISLMNCNNEFEYNKYILHKGRIKEELKNVIEELSDCYKLEDINVGAITGSGSKFLAKYCNVEFVNEVTAVVEGSLRVNNDINSIIEIGGQSAKYITNFSEQDKSKIDIAMNSNCSAGTGSFLEEQISRLNLKLEDYSTYANKAKSIPRIAGRCSVFAKTDITHHQQEGVCIEDILLGLAYAVIKNYRGSVIKKLPIKKPILLLGGIGYNEGIIIALKDVLNLNEEELIIPDNFSNIGAIGAAYIAKKEEMSINLKEIASYLENNKFYKDENDEIKLPELKLYGEKDSLNKHIGVSDNNNEKELYLGVDIGSTSTNLVLMDNNNNIVHYKYLKTHGNPIKSIKIGLKEIKDKYEEKIKIIGVGITGSGRYMIGNLIGADIIKDEITAQAKAAVTIDKNVDTVFEIGGQDSKYISISNGVVTDFQMNKICAAGTGSFIEEQAKKFNIPINEFGDIALNSNAPINLGERCTVFMETSIGANLSRGENIEDIVSGLCYSITKNYINRVVGQKKIGKKIFLQGGIAYNQGIVNAFRVITGKEIYVPPFFSVTGAYGVAILAKEEGVKESAFKGFLINDNPIITNDTIEKVEVTKKKTFNDTVHNIVFEGYTGKIDKNKKTVGIPRALFTYGMYPMFNVFFEKLGLNVLLSNKTSEKTIELGQKYSLDETCYPVKLVNGHIAELMEKNVDYIFFPDLFTVEHIDSHTRQNYGCAYMQLAFKMVNRAMELDKKGIELLSPTIAFNLGPKFMKESFLKIGKQLGKNSEETIYALQEGVKAAHNFEKILEDNSKKVMSDITPNEKVFVIISKIYGVVDPILNMSIPDKLMNMGYKVISFFDLPEGDLVKEHPNMYWPFGQHILEAAQIVKQQANFYGIFLTHHCCGPDTVLTHYFNEIMGNKPYLNIEVDEHSSSVGVITRVEAFINSLNKIEVEKVYSMETNKNKISHKTLNIVNSINDLNNNSTVYLPYIYPYSEIGKELLNKKGINAKNLPQTNKESINIGRKYTLTNEYFSLTALLGDVLKKLEEVRDDNIAILVPQTEGTEVYGQYNRLLRTKLNEQEFKYVSIVAPFIEDILYKDKKDLKIIFLALLAGDIIRTSDKKYRNKYLNKIIKLIRNNKFEIEELKNIAINIYTETNNEKYNKKIFAIGEDLILYNDFMNNFTFSSLEEMGNKVIYSPLSEAMLIKWNDFLNHNVNENLCKLQETLYEFRKYINEISTCLVDESPFEKNLDNIITIADETIGYYSGGNGRYREAKILGNLPKLNGIIRVSSMYENTGIALNVLHDEFKKENTKPILNLTFDGNKNENDKTKIESFMYYI